MMVKLMIMMMMIDPGIGGTFFIFHEARPRQAAGTLGTSAPARVDPRGKAYTLCVWS